MIWFRVERVRYVPNYRIGTFRTALSELKESGYIDEELNRDSKVLFKYKYMVHRKPSLERNFEANNPTLENRSTDSRTTENQQKLNNKKIK